MSMTGRPIRRPMIALAAIALVGVVVAACSGAASPTPTSGGLTVEGAWARTSTGMANAGAAYLVVKNPTGIADALVGVSTPAAGSAQIHETYTLPAPSGSMMPATSGAAGGSMMAMRPVAKIEVPAGGTIELKPGGYHIMLMGLTHELTAGETIVLTLTFEKASPITVTADVRAS